MGPSLTASDIVRSMMRVGFSHDEIYDVLTGVGLPGDQVQLLIDRVSAEFHDAGLEPQTSRLAKEVQNIFKIELDEALENVSLRMSSISREMELIKVELEKLSKRVVDLQKLIVALPI